MADLHTLDALSLFARARQHAPDTQNWHGTSRALSQSRHTTASLIEASSSCPISATCIFINMCVRAALICPY
ncbi:hypothetical protein LZ31DRAFT_552363 [Colletotrichum somersetense]|nr:hypothetical protein LZ31DRAFT_552363 [Colletotrichum somersetense]